MSDAFAIHAKDEDNCFHAVAVGMLRVLIQKDGDQWFAQGVEIDYFAGGSSIEDVQDRFERGLKATIQEHLKRYNNIEKFLKFAPESAWKKLMDAEHFHFNNVSFHDLEEEHLPMQKIAYLQEAA